MAEIIKTANPLPPPACGYASEQERFDAFVEALGLEIVGGLEWQASVEEPSDLSLHWLKLDADGRAIAALEYSDADARYVRWISQSAIDGVVSGSGNAFSLSFSPAFNLATGYHTGRRYVFIANHTITDEATLEVDGLGPITILKFGGSGLASGDIVSGQVVDVVISGTFAWLQTPVRPSAISAASVRAAMVETTEYPVPGEGTALTIPHDTEVMPMIIRVVAVCKIASTDGYALGDELDITGITSVVAADLDRQAYNVSADDENITVAASDVTSGPSIQRYVAKGGGEADWDVAVAAGAWQFKAYIL